MEQDAVALLSRKSRDHAVADRRRAARIELKRGSVKVDSKTFTLKNLSTQGFLLTPYDGDLVARQRVYLTLTLQVDGQELDYATDAQVVRIDARNLAGRFNDLRPDARRAIARIGTRPRPVAG
jgi:hypothetical protein